MIRRRNVFKLFLICGVLTTITNFPSGFTNSSVNTAVVELMEFINDSYVERGWNLDSTHQSLIRSATLNSWFVAQVIGSVFAPFLTDTFGRKVAYLISTGVMTLASAVQCFATVVMMPELLIVGRIMAALCSPLSDAALILYLQECSPIHYRGAFSFLGEVGYCLMCVLGMVLGMRAVLGDSLTKLLGWSILPGVFFFAFLFFVPETPKFLMIVRKDRQRALESLEFFQGEKKENERLLDDYLREATHDDRGHKSSIKEVVTTWYLRHAVILACCVLILTLSFYPILQSSTYFFQSIDIDRYHSKKRFFYH
jgi:MFS family permease